jgi:hypothetical protein
VLSSRRGWGKAVTLGTIAAGFLSLASLSFDMTALFAMVDPGRERIAISGSDGDIYRYACKTGPAGETPRAQAERAHQAFEQNLEKFAEAAVAGLMAGAEAGDDSFNAGLSFVLKADSWAKSISLHLEQEFGCTVLG